MALPEAKMVMFVDFARLDERSMELLQAMGNDVPDDDDDGDGKLEEVAAACDVDLDGDVQEIMMSVLPDKTFAVAARMKKSAPAIVECLARLGNKRFNMDGLAGVDVGEDVQVIAVDRDVLLFGDADGLEVAADGGAPRWLKAVGSDPEARVAVHLMVEASGLWMVSTSIRGTEKDGDLIATFRGATTADADFIANTFRETAADVAREVSEAFSGKKTKRRVREWLSKVTVKRSIVHGVDVVVPLAARVNSETRGKALKQFTKLMGQRVDRKRSEQGARQVVWALVERVQQYAAKQSKSGSTRKGSLPPTAPLTPRSVPAGGATTVGAKAWEHAAWKALEFSVDGPQRFAYEVHTSPDRRRATIRAVGDLDGDGVKQTLELGLQLHPSGRVVPDPFIRVQNPFE